MAIAADRDPAGELCDGGCRENVFGFSQYAVEFGRESINDLRCSTAWGFGHLELNAACRSLPRSNRSLPVDLDVFFAAAIGD
jgi:hypothetical protein